MSGMSSTMALPTELLAIITQYASTTTLACLARVSKNLYFIAIRALYASIPHMSTQRTSQCLVTLSKNASLARLVRTYALKITTTRSFKSLPDLVTRALANMSNITDLSLQLGIFATSAVLQRATCKLTKFVCVLASDTTYPISRFLESQPGIEELYVVCRSDGLSDLSPDALPVLRDVAAPPRTLPTLLSSRLGHVTRISVLGTIANPEDIVSLGNIFREAPTRPRPGRLIDLVLGVDLTPHTMMLYLFAKALINLGEKAPWIGLLRLEVHKGNVKQDTLEHSFTAALPYFPNLKTLVLMSQPPLPSAYIHESRSESALHTWQLGEVKPFELPQPTEPPSDSRSRSAPPPPQPQWPAYIPDALHNRSTHMACLSAWHHAQPGLERVVFPIGVYTFVGKEEDVNERKRRTSVSLQRRSY